MLTEILKQIIDRGLDASISAWFEKRWGKAESPTIAQAEHILDWIEAKNPPKLAKMRWDEVLKESEKWTKAEQKKGQHISEKPSDTKVFMKIGEFKIVQLVGQNAFKREGHLMSHCVASYYGKPGIKIYSLRDKKNNPHCTFEVVGDKQIQQIKGKGNGPIHPLYIDSVVQFLEKLGMSVRDSEMRNLGYLNVEKYKEHLHKDTIKSLFREKYWNQKDKLLGKDGDEFATLDFLDDVDLISDTHTGLKINFELKSFIKLSIDFLFKQSKKWFSGNYTRNASSGNSTQNASSGDFTQNASSGDFTRNASSGNSTRNASSGDSTQNASSGNSTRNASSGDSTQNEMLGLHSVSVDAGHGGIVKGKVGCWFCLSEWEEINGTWIPKCVKAAKIDGIKIKADTWYQLKNGEFIEVKP